MKANPQMSLGRNPGELNHYLRHGGELRMKLRGRKARPLSTKEPLHLVFKIDKLRLKSRSLRWWKTYRACLSLSEKYSKRFWIKIEQISIQNDHIHILIRTGRRSNFQSFFRVLSGQIAQTFSQKNFLVTDTPFRKTGRRGTGLWLYRPYSRIVRGWKAYKTAVYYVKLNELEAQGKIPYRKERLRGLSSLEWELLLKT